MNTTPVMQRFPWVMLLAIALMLVGACEAQVSQGGGDIKEKGQTAIKWMKFEDAVKLSESDPRKIFIDVYTHWCGWCKRMDATTFSDTSVASYINSHFYPVKLDAETKDTIRFRDKSFTFVSEFRANELAVSLLSGKMGYPSYVILDENFSMLVPPIQSYMVKDELMPIITYFGDNIFKTKTWEEYTAKKSD